MIEVVEKPAYGLIKSSVLLFHRRIIRGLWFTRLHEVLIMVTVVWTIAILSANVFICGGHPQAQWSRLFASQKCADINVLLLWFAITDVIGDLMILRLSQLR